MTLPSAWVERYGLKPRHKVEVIVRDELVIRPVPRRDTPALLRSLISGNFQRELRITVPVWWLRLHGLKPGDKVEGWPTASSPSGHCPGRAKGK